MPHSTNPPTVNGDSSLTTSSHFLNHLTHLPLISSTLTTLQTNPYTSPPLTWAATLYTRLASPVAPYLRKPYSYAQPYVARADELADTGLGRVEAHFPIVKASPEEIVAESKKFLYLPVQVFDQGREYVVETWNDEYSKTLSHTSPTSQNGGKGRQPGLSTSLLALLSTELKLASDFFQRVADVLGPKHEGASKASANIAQRVVDVKGEVQRVVGEKAAAANGYAQKTAAEGKGKVQGQ